MVVGGHGRDELTVGLVDLKSSPTSTILWNKLMKASLDLLVSGTQLSIHSGDKSTQMAYNAPKWWKGHCYPAWSLIWKRSQSLNSFTPFIVIRERGSSLSAVSHPQLGCIHPTVRSIQSSLPLVLATITGQFRHRQPSSASHNSELQESMTLP